MIKNIIIMDSDTVEGYLKAKVITRTKVAKENKIVTIDNI